jgi:hypothetical protein
MPPGAIGNLNPTADYVAGNVVATGRCILTGKVDRAANSLSTFDRVAPGPDNSAWKLLWDGLPAYRVNGGVPSPLGADSWEPQGPGSL